MTTFDEEELSVEEATKQYAEQLRSQREQKQRQRLTDVLADWVWVSEATVFVRRSDHRIWNDKQWRTHYAHLHPKGDVFSFVLRQGLVQTVERLAFEPYETEFLDDGSAYNTWRPSAIEPREGDAQWFLDHIAFLFPDETVADYVLDYLALLVREPWEKVLFFLLIVGVEQGTGKTAITEVAQRLIGPHNSVAPSNDEIGSQFTGWQEGKQLAVVHELMMLGRQQISNRLKPVATEPLLSIRVMYRAAYAAPNRLTVIATSNHLDALKIDNADRRWLVVETQAKQREPEYYEALWAHIDSEADLAAVKWMLQNRDVKLNPKGKAPVTVAKREMVEQALPDEEAFLLELFEEGEAPFDFDLVRTTDLIDAVQARFPGSHKDLMGRITSLLKGRIGAVRHTRDTSPGNGRPKWRLWSVRNHDDWAKAGPTARVEAYQKHRDRFYLTSEEPGASAQSASPTGA